MPGADKENLLQNLELLKLAIINFYHDLSIGFKSGAERRSQNSFTLWGYMTMIFNEKKKIKRNTFTANPPFVFICPFPKGNVQGLERLLSLSPMSNQTLIPRRPYQMLNY